MTTTEIRIAKVYATDGHESLTKALNVLRDEEQIMGATITRGIAGMGSTGFHTAALIDLSLELPFILEFYDESLKVEKAVQMLKSRFNFKHIISWAATAHF